MLVATPADDPAWVDERRYPTPDADLGDLVAGLGRLPVGVPPPADFQDHLPEQRGRLDDGPRLTHPLAEPPHRHQSGAALIVSLILLMVLTVLAVSTMRTASLELLMAGNAQYPRKRLPACPVRHRRGPARRRTGGRRRLHCAAGRIRRWTVPELGGRYVTTVCYRGESITPGNSFPRFPTYNYEVASTGRTDQRGCAGAAWSRVMR